MKNSQEEHFLSFFFFQTHQVLLMCCQALVLRGTLGLLYLRFSGFSQELRAAPAGPQRAASTIRRSGYGGCGIFFFQDSKWHENLLDTPYPPLSPAPLPSIFYREHRAYQHSSILTANRDLFFFYIDLFVSLHSLGLLLCWEL